MNLPDIITKTGPRAGGIASGFAVLLLIVMSVRDPGHLFLTADQRGQRLFDRGEFAAAVEAFADPNRKAIALFRDGQFEEAASIFQGIPGTEAIYNQGNAFLMAGKYEDAAKRFERALQLQPDWEDAAINHGIALARAEMLKTKGGDMTGGQMGADDFVFDKNPSRQPGGGQEEIEGGGSHDSGISEMWLRQVQTTPSDFLKAKFSYQAATRE